MIGFCITTVLCFFISFFFHSWVFNLFKHRGPPANTIIIHPLSWLHYIMVCRSISRKIEINFFFMFHISSLWTPASTVISFCDCLIMYNPNWKKKKKKNMFQHSVLAQYCSLKVHWEQMHYIKHVWYPNLFKSNRLIFYAATLPVL